jgi:hypothetical protein
MGKCKRSHSRDRKTFPAFGNAKGLLPSPEVEHLVGNLKVEGSRPACAKLLFLYTTGKSGGAENVAENSGTTFLLCTN